MHTTYTAALLALLAATTATAADNGRDGRNAVVPGLQFAPDPTGIVGVVNLGGLTQRSGPFFQSLGTNGRSCATCHVAAQGMGSSAAGVRTRFAMSGGSDPLFAPVDGANCPGFQGRDPAVTACCCAAA